MTVKNMFPSDISGTKAEYHFISHWWDSVSPLTNAVIIGTAIGIARAPGYNLHMVDMHVQGVMS
jgi:hypothetical protein